MTTLVTDGNLYRIVLYTVLALAGFVFPALYFITPAYGRYARGGWGPMINATFAWVVMEAPSPLLFAVLWGLGDPARRSTVPGLIFLGMWELHYLNRTLVFPFRRRGGAPRMPLSIPLLSILFNLINAYLNAGWLYVFGPVRDVSWLADPRFLLGVLLFGIGFFINQQSDQILFHLRKPGETGYKIPHGGFYRWVSCPNYLGEIVEWSGFALATWSPAGLVFVLWTMANLVPRARTHHLWYREKFSDYPADRRAIFPLLY